MNDFNNIKIYEQKFEKYFKKLLTNLKIKYKICSTKSEQEFVEQKFY